MFLIFFSLTGFTSGQSVFAPLNPDYYPLIDRYEIRQGKMFEDHFSSVKPYYRKKIVEFIEHYRDSTPELSPQDEFNLNYLVNDSWEWADSANNQGKKTAFKSRYNVNSDLFHVKSDGFDLHVNPVLYLGVGSDENAPATPYINSRGVELRGMIDEKVGFYTFLAENQVNLPGYVVNSIDETLAVPGEGFWKGFKDNGYDFFTARG
jgi:hypothetical protein